MGLKDLKRRRAASNRTDQAYVVSRPSRALPRRYVLDGPPTLRMGRPPLPLPCPDRVVSVLGGRRFLVGSTWLGWRDRARAWRARLAPFVPASTNQHVCRICRPWRY